MSVRSSGHHHRTRGARLSRGLLLLAAAAVAVAALGATAAHAAATVTGGHCGPAGSNPWAAGSCVSGSTLRLAGTGLDSAMTVAIGTSDQQPAITCPTPTVNDEKTTLTCTVTYTGSVATGDYPVTLTLSGTETSAGSVIIGTVLQQSIPTWNAPTAQQFTVTGVSSTSPTSGDSWSIQGNFDTSATYEVLFYNTESDMVAGNDGKTPVCTVTQVAADALTCTITIDAAVMGAWGLLVRNTATQAFLSVPSSIGTFTVNPPAPFVTHITGPCAMDESKCVTGAVLTMVGGNFNYRSPSYNSLILTMIIPLQQTFYCDITDVTATTLTCTMTVSKFLTPGQNQDVYIQVQVSSSSMSTQYSLGQMLISGTQPNFLAVWQSPQTTSTDSFVTSLSSTNLVSGNTWVVYGTFHTDRLYKILFGKEQFGIGAGGSNGSPTCTSVTVTSNAISCVLQLSNSALGPFYYQVWDTSYNAQVTLINTVDVISVAPPLPQVTLGSGACTLDSSKCVTGANIVFTGTNFYSGSNPQYNQITFGDNSASDPACTVTAATETQVTCELAVSDSVLAGAYPAYAQVATSPSGDLSPAVRIGTLVVGSFPPHQVAGWSTKDLTTENLIVSGTSTTQPVSGGRFTIYGTFDPAATYDIMFYTTEPQFVAGNNGKTPTCTGTTVQATSLQCTIVVGNSIMGTWAFLVSDDSTGAILPGSTSLNTLAVIPPLPTVTGASGDCAQDSTKCVTGAELTLTGSNFNTRSPSYNKVTVGSADSGSRCAVTKVDATSLTCTLSIKDGAAKQALQLFVQVQVGTPDMLSPQQPAGMLVLSGGSGWVNGFIQDDGATEGVIASSSGVSKVWMVLAIVFAITSALLLLGICVLWFCGRSARSTGKGEADGADAASMSGDFDSYVRAPDTYGMEGANRDSSSRRKASL